MSYIKSTSKRRPIFESNLIKLILKCSNPAQWRSVTVLSYIKSTSKRRPIFESNLIKLILKCSNQAQWRWVDMARIPADLFSRDVHPSQVHKTIQRIRRPAFLLQGESVWPARESAGMPEDGDSDNCKLMAAVTSESVGILRAGDGRSCASQDLLWRLISRYSSLHRTVSAVAWLLRV